MEARAIIRADGTSEVSGVTTPIPWWSFTKTALALALLRLSDRGRIDLDEAVADHPFTAAQLLRHQAGLPDYGALAAYHADVELGRPPWPIDRLLQAAEADRLIHEPGDGWAYSNIGYWHVARLIERVTDQPLAGALADLVFVPAGVGTARLATAPDDLAGVTMGDAHGYHPGWVYHGLIVGTALDAVWLLRQTLDGTLLSPPSLRRMLDGTPLPQFRSGRYPDPAYAMGLMLWATDTLAHPIGHTGGGPGSAIAVYSQKSTVCAVWAGTSAVIDPVAEAFAVLKRENR